MPGQQLAPRLQLVNRRPGWGRKQRTLCFLLGGLRLSSCETSSACKAPDGELFGGPFQQYRGHSSGRRSLTACELVHFPYRRGWEVSPLGVLSAVADGMLLAVAARGQLQAVVDRPLLTVAARGQPETEGRQEAALSAGGRHRGPGRVLRVERKKVGSRAAVVLSFS